MDTDARYTQINEAVSQFLAERALLGTASSSSSRDGMGRERPSGGTGPSPSQGIGGREKQRGERGVSEKNQPPGRAVDHRHRSKLETRSARCRRSITARTLTALHSKIVYRGLWAVAVLSIVAGVASYAAHRAQQPVLTHLIWID